ncbi:MAG: chromate transporter [Candidatus Gastranaerophilales bacterium]|nr:chromate transporter [Candidatus Gastranaerophilales bacterium]
MSSNKDNKIKLFDIFYVFLKIGIVLVGGGYVILPLLNSEIVEKKKWMSYDEILDKFCISQCLPGIIVANTALFVGYKLRGIAGAIAAIVGVTISAFVIIISLANILSVIFHNKVVNNIFDYVNLSVIVLILVTLKDMFPKCIVDKTTSFLFLVCLYLILGLKISPFVIIFISIILGFVISLIKKNKGVVKSK